MKPFHFVLAIGVFASTLSIAQQNTGALDMKKHKIVFQFADSDSVSQVRVNQQIGNALKLWPNAEIEIVCLGAGLDLLMTKNSKASQEVANWSAKGVVYAACNNTMNMRNVKKEDLLKEAVVVPAAVVELAMKQEQGWSYFRSGRY